MTKKKTETDKLLETYLSFDARSETSKGCTSGNGCLGGVLIFIICIGIIFIS